MSLISLPGILQQQSAGGGGGPSFFGSYSMLREFSAEDPDWSDPGDAGEVDDWRDNGTIGANLAPVGTGAAVTYVSSGVNSLPSISFNATSVSSGEVLRTTVNTPTVPITVGVVGKFDTVYSSSYFTDCGQDTGRIIIGGLTSVGGKWRAMNNIGMKQDTGTNDTDPHFFVLYLDDNDMEFWIDGSSESTDTSDAAIDPRGMTIGGALAGDASLLNGLVPYAFQYSGDLTADGGFSTWANSVASYYGLTEGW